MPNTIVTAFNLLTIYVDIIERACIRDVSEDIVVLPWGFARGDTLKGSIYTVAPTGIATPPFYQLEPTSYQLALTDGWSTKFVTATGWESQGGTTNPHFTFNLAVSGTALDAVLHGLTGPYNAFLEIEIAGIASSEGSSYPQNQYIIREAALIYPTALNPAP